MGTFRPSCGFVALVGIPLMATLLGSVHAWAQVPVVRPAYRVGLVGDAGKAASEPGVVRALADVMTRSQPRDTLVAFLGDNVYRQPEVGRMPKRWPDLDEQLQGASIGGEVLFVPGNHDWGDTPDDGLSVLEREHDYVVQRSHSRNVRFLPNPGCPGPVRVVDNRMVKILVIDSAWWLRDPAERAAVTTLRGCATSTEKDVVRRLRDELACPDAAPCPPRVVLAHHPIISYGSHAGYFGWRDHFLCAGYLPLPGICSLTIGLRKLGIGEQDMTAASYRAYIAAMHEAFEPSPPLVFATGHEHALQVLRDDDGVLHVISGAGSRLGSVGHGPLSLYARARPGLAVLDFGEDGSIVLRMFVVDGARGRARIDYEQHVLP